MSLSVPQIKDREGRVWNIEINPWSIRRVREALNINLLEMLEKDSTLAEDLEDPVRSVELVWCLCQPQAAEREVSEKSFWESLDQDMLDSAGLAIMEGIANFSRAAIRPALETVAAKTAKLRDRLTGQVQEAIASGELERYLDKEMDKLLDGAPIPAVPANGPTTSSPTASSLSASSETSTPNT
jgi:hypothetical protein